MDVRREIGQRDTHLNSRAERAGLGARLWSQAWLREPRMEQNRYKWIEESEVGRRSQKWMKEPEMDGGARSGAGEPEMD